MSAISTKMNTKTWTDKPSAEMAPKLTNLTEEQKKQMGGEDLSQILNKASDPNYVDPKRKVDGHGNPSLDKDAFFKLMLTQLKQQDPTNPLKNHEMAAQLAQFSTLEQMSNMNSTLTKIEGKNSEPQNFQALNLIGKTVAGDSSKIARSQFDKGHDFNFNATQEMTEATVKVMNDKGEAVREFKLHNLKEGANKITWNGMNESGDKQAPGDYQFKIEAKNKLGDKVNVKTDFEGKISGIRFAADGPVLQVGQQSIKMRDVRQITDSSAMTSDQNVNNLNEQDLNIDAPTKHNNIKKEANTSSNTKGPPPGASDVMTGVAMSRETMNDLQKAGTALDKAAQKTETK